MPSLSSLDERHLARALALAIETVGIASPNPNVGCVLADAAGTVLGEGAHRYDLRDHAEIVALQAAAAAGHAVRGAIAYVTLEPCAHRGRTGPCADALIAAGIARCVVAAIDPNPLTRNLGLGRLREAGIRVDVLNRTHPIASAARRLNDAFAHSIQRHRPFVTLKAALSRDGYLAPPPAARSAGEPHWLTGAAARADVQQLRHAADAILTGIGTVLADDPILTDRTGLSRRRPLLRIVLDSQLRTPPTSRLVQTAADDLLLVAAADAPADRKGRLRDLGAQVFTVTGTREQHLAQLMAELERREILSLLLEGGSAVNGSFLTAGLVDRVILYRGPAVLGRGAIPFAQNGPSPEDLQKQLSDTTRAEFPAQSDLQIDTRVAGYLHDPWAK